MPARRIDDTFTAAARDMHADGKSKEAVARALGCCQRTVRRALAALAEAGSAHVVDPVGYKPARLGEANPGFGEALAREAAAGFLPAYA